MANQYHSIGKYKKGENKMKINKAEIVKEFGKNEQDTGSIEVQIALLSC